MDRPITPTYAVRRAAENLDTAGNNALHPAIANEYVAVADGWTRLYAALSAAGEPDALTIRETEIDGMEVVVIPEKARDLLEALGWTPPAGDQ